MRSKESFDAVQSDQILTTANLWPRTSFAHTAARAQLRRLLYTGNLLFFPKQEGALGSSVSSMYAACMQRVCSGYAAGMQEGALGSSISSVYAACMQRVCRKVL